MHALQYKPAEQMVYRTAVQLAQEMPDGFDATHLATRIGCDVQQAGQWLSWLRQTGDFGPPQSEPSRP